MKKIEEILLESFVEIDELKRKIEGKQQYIDELIEERGVSFKRNKLREEHDSKLIDHLKKEHNEIRVQLEASRNLARKQQEQLEQIESEEGYIRELTEQVTTLRTANNNLTAVKAEQDKVNKKLQTEIFNHKCGYENSVQTIEKKDKIIEELKHAIDNQEVVIKSYQKDIERLERDVK